jgi:hypothetical protein
LEEKLNSKSLNQGGVQNRQPVKPSKFELSGALKIWDGDWLKKILLHRLNRRYGLTNSTNEDVSPLVV